MLALIGGGRVRGLSVRTIACSRYTGVGEVRCAAGGRIGYRKWARKYGRLEEIHSLDDRYDHDIDELMA
jgi:hypothetical protein